MNVGIKNLTLSLAVASIELLGMTHAIAGSSAGPSREDTERARTEQQAQAERNVERNVERNEHKKSGDGSVTPPPNEHHKPTKMSPEERRDLRRQINEAGQDIYTPKQ